MAKRQIEIFVADCPLCNETVRLVRELSCPSCEVLIYDLREGQTHLTYLEKAQQYGVQAVPALAIDGKLALTGKPNREQLQAIGVGQPLN
ncbi:thioredoxin family protein [Chroococcidiopsis sp. CCNUC1]|uniref:thioredoxin family protein n=1 Tax=Chroococcidiopsis sp. CCNUC1 TaxID=2653189 RepID=UPI002020D4D1|nr:thioredoxin family protein [Chroococcidiopsis sp. CCNUC1]URD53644.1 thioredoxin family protein [Chroococcidiopsis sp. CCNUC1]